MTLLDWKSTSYSQPRSGERSRSVHIPYFNLTGGYHISKHTIQSYHDLVIPKTERPTPSPRNGSPSKRQRPKSEPQSKPRRPATLKHASLSLIFCGSQQGKTVPTKMPSKPLILNPMARPSLDGNVVYPQKRGNPSTDQEPLAYSTSIRG